MERERETGYPSLHPSPGASNVVAILTVTSRPSSAKIKAARAQARSEVISTIDWDIRQVV